MKRVFSPRSFAAMAAFLATMGSALFAPLPSHSDSLTIIEPGGEETIAVHGVCRIVGNSGDFGVMVPHMFPEEWAEGNSSFLSFASSDTLDGISVSACPYEDEEEPCRDWHQFSVRNISQTGYLYIGLARDPARNLTVLIGVLRGSSHGISAHSRVSSYYSTDNFRTRTRRQIVATTTFHVQYEVLDNRIWRLDDIVFSPTHGAFFVTGPRTYRSFDGHNWTTLPNRGSSKRIAEHNGTIIAGRWDGENMLRSTDGNDFQVIRLPSRGNSPNFIKHVNGKWFAGGHRRLFVSHDDGLSWQQLRSSPGEHFYHDVVYVSGTYYVSASIGSNANSSSRYYITMDSDLGSHTQFPLGQMLISGSVQKGDFIYATFVNLRNPTSSNPLNGLFRIPVSQFTPNPEDPAWERVFPENPASGMYLMSPPRFDENGFYTIVRTDTSNNPRGFLLFEEPCDP